LRGDVERPGCSGVGVLSRLSSANLADSNLADLAIRGLAISFLRLAGIPLADRFLVLLRCILA
jgi:hypothetical protein